MWESEVSFRGRHWESISACLSTFFYKVWTGEWTFGTLRRHRCCHMATLGHGRTTLLHLRCGGPWWARPASAAKSWVAPWAELRTLPCAHLGLSAIPASFTVSLPTLAVALMGRSVCTAWPLPGAGHINPCAYSWTEHAWGCVQEPRSGHSRLRGRVWEEVWLFSLYPLDRTSTI